MNNQSFSSVYDASIANYMNYQKINGFASSLPSGTFSGLQGSLMATTTTATAVPSLLTPLPSSSLSSSSSSSSSPSTSTSLSRKHLENSSFTTTFLPSSTSTSVVSSISSIDDQAKMMPSNQGFHFHHSNFYSAPYTQEHHQMLGMDGLAKMMPTTCHASLRQQQPVIVSRCDAPSSDVSATTSSSCSPSSASATPPQTRKPEACVGTTSEAMMNAMKIEPMESMDYQQSLYRQVHIGYGVRCSSTEDSTTPTSSTNLARLQISSRRSRSSQDGMLKCQFCPKKAADPASLENHMQDCRLIRSHECSHCGKRFKARGGLQQHMRIHNNERPYACTYCTKRFTQKSHVDQHERIHTGSKPFNCQFCGRSFRQRSQQMGHEATHSNASTTSNDDHSAMRNGLLNIGPSNSSTSSTVSNPSVSDITASGAIRSSVSAAAAASATGGGVLATNSVDHHLNALNGSDCLTLFGPLQSTSTSVTSLLALSQQNHGHPINDMSQHMLSLGQQHLGPTMNAFNQHSMPQAILNQML